MIRRIGNTARVIRGTRKLSLDFQSVRRLGKV